MKPLEMTATARTLYAELREQALVVAASAPLGERAGSVVRKLNKGRSYLYFQTRGLDGRLRQQYLGAADEPVTDALVARLTADDHARGDEATRLNQLRAAFIAAGGVPLNAPTFRVVQAFAQAGVLSPGVGHAVLVGTNAFQCLGNLLGVRWQTALQTQDIDVAADVDDGVELAVTRPEAAAPDVLERLAMGFLPVPPLDPRAPSTSYFIRGHELRVDLLTPLLGRESKPQFVPALGAPASPVRHLDFVLVDPVVALAIGSRDLAVIQVPAPARFALHKLMVSTLRPAVFATKADKDRQQAMQLLHALVDNAPDDIAAAWTDLQGRGPGWKKKVERALGVCRRADPALIDALMPLLNG
jgi:hypothetical protein